MKGKTEHFDALTNSCHTSQCHCGSYNFNTPQVNEITLTFKLPDDVKNIVK